MSDQIINNFYFARLFYIVIVVSIGFAVINDLKNKEKLKDLKNLLFFADTFKDSFELIKKYVII